MAAGRHGASPDRVRLPPTCNASYWEVSQVLHAVADTHLDDFIHDGGTSLSVRYSCPTGRADVDTTTCGQHDEGRPSRRPAGGPLEVDRPGTTARRGWLRSRGQMMFTTAMEQNVAELRSLVHARSSSEAVVCDIGCWDATSLLRYAPPDATLTGLELSEQAARVATTRGVAAVVADISSPWPLRDASLDLVTSNQVIEHVPDTDHFVGEVFRVLRPGGSAVISTENLASWHNIAALLFGWQPFSITNVSTRRASIGNPMSNLRHGEDLGVGWQHVRVFAHRGLMELFEVHGFTDVSIHGAGYYPLPSGFGRRDPRHAAFITVAARRPVRS